MPVYNPLSAFFSHNDQSVITIDGALATQLQAQGADLDDPLWSCKTLIERPELIQAVHLTYFNSGAAVAITASYQASIRGLVEHRSLSVVQSKALIRSSVFLAQAARREFLATTQGRGKRLLVAGSVGPYGAYLADGSEYRGHYPASIGRRELMDFHRPRLQALVEAGVDILALETIPNRIEIEALLELLRTEFENTTAWMSFSLKDGLSICDGTNLVTVAKLCEASEQVVAVGVNCVARELVAPALTCLRKGSNKTLLAYPNSGEIYDAQHGSWSGVRLGGDQALSGWETLVREWHGIGARLIGGCCRTGPKDIASIRRTNDSFLATCDE